MSEINLTSFEHNVPSINFQERCLNDNLSDLFKQLRTELLKARLEANYFSLISFDESKIVTNYEPPPNTPEGDALEKFGILCEKEAAIITKAIFEFIKAAQSPLEVKVIHFDSSTPNSQPQHSSLAEISFPILEGGNSVPRGLKINI